MIWKKKKKVLLKYCPNCRKEVPVHGGAGFFSAVIGILMFYLGGAPGTKQSREPRCTFCNTEIPDG